MSLNQTRPRRSAGGRPGWLAITVLVIAALTFVIPIAVNFYTDFQWFGEVGYRGVFATTWLTRIVLFITVGLITGALTFLSMWLAWRSRPVDLGLTDPRSPQAVYRRMAESGSKSMFTTLPVVFGVLGGLVGQGNWQTVQLFLNRQSFGETDPQYGKDLGFYAFQLPLWSYIVSTLVVLVVIAFLLSLVTHYFLGGIRPGNPTTGEKTRVSNAARAQLACWAGVFMLLKAVSYWLDRYELLNNKQKTFTGGSYTDINALLPAKITLLVIAIVVAAAFFASIFLRNLSIPAFATVLMLVSAGLIGVAWPMAVEQFSVNPNRASKEREYIARNIESTRYHYGLTDDKVKVERDWGVPAEKEGDKEAAKEGADSISRDAATLANIRILDPEVLPRTFTQQRQLKNFYGFSDPLAIDRYQIDGASRDFIVAARELNPQTLQGNQTDWINRHTVYTHGNGFVAAPANKVDEVASESGSARGGYPLYTVADLFESEDPNGMNLNLKQPRIYYGPVIANSDADYAIVGGNGDGKDYEYDADGRNFTYDGEGGVGVGGLASRMIFATRYQELNILLSDRIGPDSKIIYNRDPRDRVQKVAPWLTTDTKTYPAVVDGRMKWIVDGYTTLAKMPYSQRMSLQETTQDSINPDGTPRPLPNSEVSYIRNSVKATVDAYDGTVELYEFDEKDPVLKAWEGVFPDVVKPKSEISEELQEHLRYPEDLFKVQRELMAKYHVSDPGVFFANDSFWSVPSDPTAPEEQNLSQPPYYVVASDPKTGKPSFQLISAFRGLEREFLAAQMSASSDPETYGQITIRALPTNTQTMGPRQAQDTMMSADEVAQDRTLLEGTNVVTNGNLLTLPVGDGEILYVEPVYTQRKGQETAFPKLLRILVAYRGQVGYGATVTEALSQVGIDASAATKVRGEEETEEQSADKDKDAADAESDDEAPKEERKVDVAARDDAARRISDALQKLNDAQKNGDYAAQGQALAELDRAAADYQKANGQ
ncbi:UPF0182 family protein [Corynebacterium amycolatum]|uniref:UPF0182 family protein n=1 Tax=Corynebacterium amycolatum TaxID=43765 RepID=UPI0012463E86|nr:UPF0182 family protein [Corynebacterium amycolatum]KAA9224727.1 UPF0182 family protein [Corynebacterium amycolatum]MDK6443063.1 UPF0182 family protein [Corynebacterium amycolatum]